MPRRLPSVLSSADLPIAELTAARLDGELFGVDSCFAPIDEIEQTHHRAASLGAVVPDRLIAEQHSAAWVWGAVARPPAPHEFCVASGARVRVLGVRWLRVREVVIDDRELASLGGMLVTTPLRTAIDLARFSARFDDHERSAVLELARTGSFGLGECLDGMDRRRNLPNKRSAAARLRSCF